MKIGREYLIARCQLVEHPKGDYFIRGKKCRPEWEIDNSNGKYFGHMLEALHLARKEANRYENPRYVGVAIYDDRRRKLWGITTKIIIIE